MEQFGLNIEGPDKKETFSLENFVETVEEDFGLEDDYEETSAYGPNEIMAEMANNLTKGLYGEQPSQKQGDTRVDEIVSFFFNEMKVYDPAAILDTAFNFLKDNNGIMRDGDHPIEGLVRLIRNHKRIKEERARLDRYVSRFRST